MKKTNAASSAGTPVQHRMQMELLLDAVTEKRSIDRPDAPKARKEVKSVRFSSSNQVQRTVSLHQMSRDEILASWYTKEEYRTIARKLNKLRRLMEHGNHEGYCTRGIERHVGHRFELLQLNRSLAYDVVFDEQSEQQKIGTRDPQRLAELYAKISAPCRRCAHRVALQDEQTVKRYLAKKHVPLCAFPSTKNKRAIEAGNDKPGLLPSTEPAPPLLPRPHCQRIKTIARSA